MKNCSRVFVASIAIMLLLGGNIWAQPSRVYVNSSYAIGNAGGHDFGHDAFNTINAGISAVAPGGTVHVAAGTYHEPQIVVVNKGLTLQGAGAASDTIDGGNAVISGAGSHPGTIYLDHTTAPVTIDGFTFVNPSNWQSQGKIVSIAATQPLAPVTISHSHFIGASTPSSNSFDNAIWVDSAHAGGVTNITNNEFDHQWQSILLELPLGGAVITGNNFHNLLASSDGVTTYVPEGMHIFSYGGNNVSAPVTINDNNFSSYNGWSILLSGGYTGSGMAQYTKVTIDSNHIAADGAGIVFRNFGSTTAQAAQGGIQGATISENTITSITPRSGSGIWLRGPNNNTTVTNNSISGCANGILSEEFIAGAGTSTGVVATQNWWGNPSGPYNATTNPVATGDTVSDNVSYSPWWGRNYVGVSHTTAWSWVANSNIQTALNLNALSPGDTLHVNMQGAYSGELDISKNVIVIFATPPVLDSLVVSSGGLSLPSNVTVSGALNLSNGNLVTGDTNKIILGTTATGPTETSNGRIIGTVEVTPRPTGRDSLHLLGLLIRPGSDDLGNVGFTRKSGSLGTVTVSHYSGIAMTWEIQTDNQPTSGRSVTFSWLSDFDNGVDINNVIIYRNTGSGWQQYAGPLRVSGDPREVTVNVTGFSDWTMSSTDDPLAVQATSFAAKGDYDKVTLTWKTQSEVNNAGFNILREDPGASSFKLIAGYATDEDLKGLGTKTSGRDYSFTDTKVKSGSTYQYKIQSVSTDGTVKDLTTMSVTLDVPRTYALYQNYPNPFNPSTTIQFDLKRTSKVVLAIYNALGQKVEELNYGTMDAGRYNEVVNLSRFASGVYHYRIQVTGSDGEWFVAIKKLVLLK